MIANGRFSLIKTTLVDYPGRVAAAVFLPGCHLSCPYCHNPRLVRRPVKPDEFDWDAESFRTFLRQRKNVLGGVVFSGGEALLHPLLSPLMEMTKAEGLNVKLDTAGLCPEALNRLVSKKLIDYAAVDLKTLPERYVDLGWVNRNGTDAGTVISQSLDILEKASLDYEVRTTVVPGFVDRSVLRRIQTLASRAPLWAWQPYIPGETLNPRWSSLCAPDTEELLAWSSNFSGKPKIIVR